MNHEQYHVTTYYVYVNHVVTKLLQDCYKVVTTLSCWQSSPKLVLFDILKFRQYVTVATLENRIQKWLPW